MGNVFCVLSRRFLYWCNGAGNHHFHLCPATLWVVCSGVAPPAPVHQSRLELKLLLGSLVRGHVSFQYPLLLQTRKESLLWIS